MGSRFFSFLRGLSLWRFVPPLLLLVAGWGIGVSAAHLWEKKLWERIPPPSPPPVGARSEEKSSIPTWETYQQIVTRNLFQVEAVQTQATQVVTAEVTNEPLPLELIGTIAGGEKISFAFVRNKNTGKIESYQVGEKILDATLIRVQRAAIALFRNGKVETISLVETTLSLSAQAQPPPPPTPPFPGILTPEPSPSSLVIRQEAENRYVIDRRSFQNVINDLGPLLTQARVIPNLTNDGKIQGYKIIAIREGSLYDKIGLKDGDIIYSINGIFVDNPEKALQLFQQLRSQTDFQIEIERGGDRRTLNYSLR
jgi:general secretion pathway protein C